jgi:type II secretory pathway component PulC
MLAIVALLALGPAPPPDLTAVGVVMGSRPAAILRAGTHSRVVSVGDSVFGGRVVGITPAGVTLEFAGARTELSVAKGLPATRPRPPATEIAEAPASPAQVMERREVERRLGQEMPRILSETAVVSLAETGQGTGISITRMAEGTLLTDVGLRVGDVLVSVNGVPVDSLATLISLWPRFQNESQLRALVLRGGQPTPLTVTLR